MIRWSIHDNISTFQAALREVHELMRDGNTPPDIVASLASRYQEKKIQDLVAWVQGLPTISKPHPLKFGLKVSLWTLLVSKVLSMPVILLSLETSLSTSVGIGLLGLSINIIAIILVYRQTPSCYLFVLIFFVLGLQNMLMFSPDAFAHGMIESLWTAIEIAAYIFVGYSSFRLNRLFPVGMLKTFRQAKRLELESIGAA